MSRRIRRSTALAAATVVTTGMVGLAPSATAAINTSHSTVASHGDRGPGQHPGKGARHSDSAFDARQPQSAAQKRAERKRAAQLQGRQSVRKLNRSLGEQGVVSMDAQTGTPREVAKLNGFLTGASSASAKNVALGYVRSHLGAFGMSSGDLGHLHLTRDYVDIEGIHHLSFEQRVGGVPVFGNGLKANVTKDGRLINVTGSPVSGLSQKAPEKLRGTLSVDQAITVARKDTKESSTEPGARDTGEHVLFYVGGALRPAIKTVTMSASDPTLDVVDAQTGRILYRSHLSSDLVTPTRHKSKRHHHGHPQFAKVFQWYPDAPGKAGRLHRVMLNKHGWLPRGSDILSGNNVHTYNDVNDNDIADANEEVHPSGKNGYIVPLVRTHPEGLQGCDDYVCTWLPKKANSWQKNSARTGVQNFYFINNWHDYLKKWPIGFTEAAGNFQKVNFTGQGQGGDPVHDESLDGAAVANGLPDRNHIDNANFATPPDGQSPTMQMYLWHMPGTNDSFLPTMGSDEADIVYHEYTHGLSHRLVVDADNNPALDSVQGGSMGEAWSDWYAMDYLVNQGYMHDSRKPGDIKMGTYVGGGQNIRSEPTDCPVGSDSPACPGTAGTDAGGYTYGDFGRIFDATGDVHAAGEIWAQTLWDLRAAVGPKLAESLVTRGMELSPTYPSYLDMRNGILQADQAIYHGHHSKAIWKVFAHRGMGFFAASKGGDDMHPVEDFSMPPTRHSARGTVSGTVTDQDSGAPAPGVTVAFSGHDSGFPGDFTAVTDGQGHYAIENVPVGTYPDVVAGGAGYDPESVTLTVTKGQTTKNWVVRRDWAASAGGASVTDFNGPDYTAYGCGPSGMINQSQSQGWGSDAGDPKHVTIELPKAVDVSELTIDPSNTCGDGPEAATAGYTVETSTDGQTWQDAASGTFGADNLGKLNPVDLSGDSGDDVKYVRYTMIDPQGGDDVAFLDSSELEIYGVPNGD